MVQCPATQLFQQQDRNFLRNLRIEIQFVFARSTPELFQIKELYCEIIYKYYKASFYYLKYTVNPLFNGFVFNGQYKLKYNILPSI